MFRVFINKSLQVFLLANILPMPPWLIPRANCAFGLKSLSLQSWRNVFNAVTAFCRSPSSAYCCAWVYCVSSIIYSGSPDLSPCQQASIKYKANNINVQNHQNRRTECLLITATFNNDFIVNLLAAFRLKLKKTVDSTAGSAFLSNLLIISYFQQNLGIYSLLPASRYCSIVLQ
jgi:hypothetical protein